jgi:hypothetical protein
MLSERRKAGSAYDVILSRLACIAAISISGDYHQVVSVSV